MAGDGFARACILVLRVVVAFLWIQNTRWKLPPNFGALRQYVQDAVDHPVFGPFATLSRTVILPHMTLFGWVTVVLEASIGAFLLAGLLTRFWGLVGVIQGLSIYLSVGKTPNEWPWSYYLIMLGCLAIAGTAAGRVLGVDAVLRPRLLRSGRAARALAVLT